MVTLADVADVAQLLAQGARLTWLVAAVVLTLAMVGLAESVGPGVVSPG